MKTSVLDDFDGINARLKELNPQSPIISSSGRSVTIPLDVNLQFKRDEKGNRIKKGPLNDAFKWYLLNKEGSVFKYDSDGSWYEVELK